MIQLRLSASLNTCAWSTSTLHIFDRVIDHALDHSTLLKVSKRRVQQVLAGWELASWQSRPGLFMIVSDEGSRLQESTANLWVKLLS